jgi:hypothetical protein
MVVPLLVLVVSYPTFIVACGKELSIRLKWGGLEPRTGALLLFELLKLAGQFIKLVYNLLVTPSSLLWTKR